MTERACRECTLCCKLLPVRDLQKPANSLCQYQRSKGCSVYHGEKFPVSCGLWSCLWLVNDDADDLPRPDRAHYVIDPSPDYVEIAIQGEMTRITCVQIWVDPKHPTAYRDPALLAWLERRAEAKHQIALVRFNSHKAIALFPPALTGDGWQEKAGTATVEHSAKDIFETMQAM